MHPVGAGGRYQMYYKECNPEKEAVSQQQIGVLKDFNGATTLVQATNNLSVIATLSWQHCTIGMCTIWLGQLYNPCTIRTLPVFTASGWGNFGQAQVPGSTAL